MENKPALTSEQRLAYIGDMADIETREFTMRKTVEQLENDKQKLRQDASTAIKSAFCIVESASRKEDTARQEVNNILEELKTLQGDNYSNPPVEPEKPECWEKWSKRKKPKSPSKPKYFDFLIDPIFLLKDLFLITFKDGIIRGTLFLLYMLLILFFSFGVILAIFILVIGLFSQIITGKYFFFLNQTNNFVIHIVSTIISAISSFFHISSGWAIFIFIILLLVFIYFFVASISYLVSFIFHTIRKMIWKKYQVYDQYLQVYDSYLIANNKYENYIAATRDHKDTLLKLQSAQQNLRNAENASRLADCKIEQINVQIALLQENIRSLHSQKQDLYSIGIIPPDYREMDCVIMLHQIFRNDLKDNMADAILLYEERVYRQDIIRGIDKIYNMMGRLNASMRAVEFRLMEVKHELQMIGSDMSNQLAAIADNQSRLLSEMEDASEAQAAYAAAQEQWQREQLAETRASRYAAEAVQRSNEKYEWYMDQHRRGFM